MSLTGIILSKGERSLITALDSITFCDERIIVLDQTKENLLKLEIPIDVKVVNHSLNGNFAEQRNFAVTLARGEWILFLDADEQVTKALATEIKQTLDNASDDVMAYLVKRRDYFWGQKIRFGETWKAASKGIVRLLRANKGRWTGAVHEVFASEGKVERLTNFIDHYPHQSVKEFVSDINSYSSIRAKEFVSTGVKVRLWQIIIYPVGKFIYTYFLLLGFLDGPAGFAYSFMMSFHSFLARTKSYLTKKSVFRKT